MDRPDRIDFNDLTTAQYEELRLCIAQRGSDNATNHCQSMFPGMTQPEAVRLIDRVQNSAHPPMSDEVLVKEITRLMGKGQKIDAIKLLRDVHPHLGLAEAKEIVESELSPDQFLKKGNAPQPAAAVNLSADVEREILELLRSRNTIAAIKRYREASGACLKDSKEAVEALGARHGMTVKSGPCFVATATFEDENADVVVALRRWRDESLIQSEAGIRFLMAYEKTGPYLARVVMRHYWLRVPLRVALAWFVRILPRN